MKRPIKKADFYAKIKNPNRIDYICSGVPSTICLTKCIHLSLMKAIISLVRLNP